jgi:hypothetical protein
VEVRQVDAAANNDPATTFSFTLETTRFGEPSRFQFQPVLLPYFGAPLSSLSVRFVR